MAKMIVSEKHYKYLRKFEKRVVDIIFAVENCELSTEDGMRSIMDIVDKEYFGEDE